MTERLTAVRQATVIYRSAGEQVTALHSIDAEFAPGTATVVAGPSGSGKSTLLRLLAGFDRPTRGSVVVHGTELSSMGERQRRRYRRRHIAVVHQSPLHNLVSDLTVAQHVAFAAQVRGRSPIDPAGLLAHFGLPRPGATLGHLSGGEQQRLAMAMAVASGAQLVLADEPTAELDRGHAHTVIEQLLEIAAGGATVVIASHDQEVLDAAPNLIRVADGRIVP